MQMLGEHQLGPGSNLEMSMPQLTHQCMNWVLWSDTCNNRVLTTYQVRVLVMTTEAQASPLPGGEPPFAWGYCYNQLFYSERYSLC